MAQEEVQLSFDDKVLGAPVEGRECGSCTACCMLPEINEPTLRKPEGVMCPNCTGSGCAIYETRPQTCRTYHCVWRRISALPEEARPDRLGVLLHLTRRAQDLSPLFKVYIKAQPVGGWEDVSPEGFKSVMSVLSRGRLAVWCQDGAEMHLAHPQGPLLEAIKGAPSTAQLTAEAEAWKDALAAF